MRCERRGGVTAVFFPAFLGSDRPLVDEVAGRFRHHPVRIEFLQSLGLVHCQASRIGKAVSSSWVPRQYGSPSIQKFW